MATTAAHIQALYIAYFNRPADYIGLPFWQAKADAAGSVEAVANAFSNSTEYSDLYAGKSNADIVNSIYVNLFGRPAEAAGLVYWANKLNTGELDIGHVAYTILSAAQNADKVAVDAKVKAATTFTDSLATSADAIRGYDGDAANAVAKAWLAGVKDEATSNAAVTAAALATVTAAAIAAHDNAAGETKLFTNSVDTLVGTAGSDTFIADNTGTSVVLSAADSVTGGAGVDTLKVYLTSAQTVSLPSLNGVENLVLNGDTKGVSVAGVTGLTSLAIEATTVNAAAISYTLAAGQTLSLASVTDATNTGNAINLNSGATVTSNSLVLNAAGSGTTGAADLGINIAGAAVDTVKIATAGVASNITLGNSGAALENLVISGSAKLTVQNTLAFANGAGSIDASALTADLKITTGNDDITFVGGSGKNTIATGTGADSLTGGAANDTLNAGSGNDTVIGGAGNDTITVGAGTVNVDAGVGDDVVIVSGLDATDVIKGGEGSDVLGLTAVDAISAATTASVRAAVSGFEILRLTTGLDAEINAGTLNFNTVQLTGDVLAGGAITGLKTGATLEFRNAGTQTDLLIAGITDAALSTDDVLNLSFKADLVDGDNYAYKVDINGINNVNVTAVDRDNTDEDTGGDSGYTLVLASTANLNKITIAGSSLVEYHADAAATALKTIDASASTGDTLIDVSLFAGLERITVKGSAGHNIITGSDKAFGDSITGGAKSDIIVGGLGADALTGGAGRDVFGLVTALDSTSSSLDKISDFGKVTVAVLAADALAMSDAVTFQATATGKGGADADLLKLAAPATLGGVQAGIDVHALISGGAGTETVTATESAKGIITLGGADRAAIDTLAEWVAIADQLAGTAGDVVAFEFGGNTFVFQQGADDSLVQLTGVTGVTGVAIAGAATAVSVGSIFVA